MTVSCESGEGKEVYQNNDNQFGEKSCHPYALFFFEKPTVIISSAMVHSNRLSVPLVALDANMVLL